MKSTLTQENDDVLYWEKLVASRKGPKYTSDIEEATIAKAHSLFSEPSTALEVGCEGGRWSRLLADWGWKLRCTEVNQSLLNICQKRMPEAVCVLVNPADTTLPCDNESVDMILCIEVPPVMHTDWFMSEASRVLRKDGVIVGVFWNRTSWRGLIHQALVPFRGRDSFYDEAYPVWKTKIRNCGFDLIDEVGMCWFPFRRKSNSPLIPIAARLERLLGLSKLTGFSPLIVFIAKKSDTHTG